jgi:hypothetical protein
MGVDIGGNSFYVVGLDEHGALVRGGESMIAQIFVVLLVALCTVSQ